MSYQPLVIRTSTPTRIKQLLKSVEDHYFRDVHTMLRLPEPDLNLLAACNFAITQVLAATVSGISVTLYSHTGGAGRRFRSLMEGFYPWSSEPGNAVTPQAGAEVIYSVIRNPLTHDLGLDLPNHRQGQKIKIKRLAMHNKSRGVSDGFIEQLEGPVRPTPMSPTVTVRPGETVVLVEAFYWGIRKMIENLCLDQSRMQAADKFLASLSSRQALK